MFHFIVFSKDRPLQLAACLETLTDKLSHGTCQIDVLARIEPPYANAYMAVAEEFERVGFVEERDFASDMDSLIHEQADYVCFMCDDVLSIADINLQDAESVLSDDKVVGVSLRLGTNVVVGMFGNEQPQPIFTPAGPDNKFVQWDINEAAGDWAYPWDVLGTIYRAEFVNAMWPLVSHAHNPSQFEDAGSRAWRNATLQHQYASWRDARTVVPTINVVQDQFANGVIGPSPVDPLFLLEAWNNGLRMDTEYYNGRWFSSWRIGDLRLFRK